MIIDYVEISDSPTRSEVIFDFVFSEAKNINHFSFPTRIFHEFF